MSGHGGGWIVTYADMITLLMAGFIVIVTFSSREVDTMTRLDSIAGGKGGTGTAGGLRKGVEKDHVVVRRSPATGRPMESGSEMPPIYSDTPLEVSKAVKASLEAQKIGKLSDNFEMVFPMGLILDSNGEISTSGRAQIHRLAAVIRQLPFEVVIQVAETSELPLAVKLFHHFFEVERLHPSRLAMGKRPAVTEGGKIWLVIRHMGK